MKGYAEFIASKERRVQPAGRVVESVSPVLYEWQRDVVEWACNRGRAAVFADCGLGKTFIQVEWARNMGERALILAPLSVARQTVRESHLIDADVKYVRDPADVIGPGVWITNYELADRFDASVFDAVVLDESSILKNVDGKTRQRLTDQMRSVPYRLACTATPAPNDVAELVNHAEYLGVMPRSEMLAAYFVHDDDGWRLKGHAADAMFSWMAEWAVALRRPSDLGYPDDGYELPPLTIHSEIVTADVEAEGQLFPTELGGVGGRHKVRKATIQQRCERAVELASSGQWIIWCGLNAEAEAITAAVDGAVNVEGSWAADDKAAALEAFQDGALRVLVTKPSIAGFGMNFQGCHKMAFVGLSDSYESYYQAIRRCYRFGQTMPVDAYIIVSDLETQIAENVRRKERDAGESARLLIKHSTLRRPEWAQAM